MPEMMRDVVQIQGGFKPSVQLPRHFFDKESNRHFVQNYIPTQETLDVFLKVRDSLQPNSVHRTKLFTGTYGTGKSDLMLMISNYVTCSADDPLLAPFYEKLRNLDKDKAASIYNARLGLPPFLLVLLQADTAITFSSFVLDGLEKELTRIGQQNVLGRTYYRAALDRIDLWEKGHPENIHRLKKELQENHSCTLAQLKRDLAGPNADSALNTFRAATLQAIGLPFHETAVIERPYEAFERAAGALVKSGEYSGIFIIADEFTYLLQKLAEPATASPDIKAIDNLAEMADDSGRYQLHFYVVSLEGFASSKAGSRTSQAALERSGGRFIRGQVELKSQYMEELIKASIVKLVPPESLFKTVPDQLDELLSLAMRLWGDRPTVTHDREWVRNAIVNGCYPLHPLTTYCLPSLNRALAQNERTMFSFIWDEQYGLKSFINESNVSSLDGWITLVPLDYLFAYFDVSLKEKRPDLYLLYQQARTKLLPEQVNLGLEGRLLKALVLLEIASGDTNLRTDSDSLRHALGLSPSSSENVKVALKELMQAGIAYPNQMGYYLLVKQGQANPSELRSIIERLAREDITKSPISVLNEQQESSDVNAVDYNRTHGTERKLSAKFVGVADLASNSLSSSQLQNCDALLWYVITNAEDERLQARSLALQLTKQYDRLVIAVPLEPTDILERLKRRMAVEDLRDTEDYSRPDYQELLADNGLVGGDYLSAFERAQQKLKNYASFEWYSEGKIASIQTLMQTEDLASRVMKKVFPSTPVHSTSQHLPKAQRNTAKLRDALDNILNAPFRRANGKKSATDAILSDGARMLGLLYVVDRDGGYNRYDTCIPDQQNRRLQNSRFVWNTLDGQLKSSVAWPNIVQQLESPPYGLYPSVLALFLAAFLHLNRDYIEVFDAKQVLNPVGVTGEIILKMIDSPENYTIRYQPLTNPQREFLQGLLRILLPSQIELHTKRADAASLRNQVAKLLYQRIREVALIHQAPSLEELTEALPDMPRELLPACQGLIEFSQLREDSERKAALLDALPEHIGLPVDGVEWDSKDINRALSNLESAYRQLQQLPKRLRQTIALQIGQWFGLSETPKDEKEVLEAALRWRKLTGVRLQDLAGQVEAQDMLGLLDDRPYNFEQVFLNALPARWKLQTFGEWQALHTKKEYMNILEKAVQAVKDQVERLSSQILEERTVDRDVLQRPAQIGNNGSREERAGHSAISGAESLTAGTNQPNSTEATPLKDVIAPRQNTVGSSNFPATPPVVSRSELHLREKPHKAELAVEVASSRNDMASDTVEQAFEMIQSIFEGLLPKDQRRLWERLVEEYDPR
ncbi:hypothetical protein KSD_30020 [Ktedonobacter sp. SOSP1-85]|uniref:hypothetical protein n=1 Tax=Ktedonobacter sp. SOSP1-85 TaxID=2778367 RepID=UPI001914EA03|nr:hypothetical protein [Ktedonobacter sp. SOSP1-85]GHO75231.1 hypothetical protein KSD_30020 [Ktedonobacter sp. SOSP1-85]